MVKKCRTCVITVNYHGTEDTVACVASLIASTVPLSIVVVDNSPDDPVLQKALTAYPDVVLLRAPENLGFGRGNNLGIDWTLANIACEFIFIFNNDAIVEPDTIEKLEYAMGQHQDLGIVAPRIVLAENPNLLWYGGGEVDWKRGGVRTPGFLGAANASLAMKSREVSFASGCAMFVRRKVMEQTKGFDPRFFMYEEDIELSIRIMKAGWKIWYLPEALVYHVGQSSLSKKDHPFIDRWDVRNKNYSFYIYHMVRNEIINAMTHAQGRDAWTFFFFYPVFLVWRLLPHLMRLRLGSAVPVLKGVWDGLRAGKKGRAL